MALVLDPTTGLYVDDGLGPQGRAQPQTTPGLAAIPLAGARGGGAVIPQTTIIPTAGGPRGVGPIRIPPPAVSAAAPAAAPAQQPAAATPPVTGLAGSVPPAGLAGLTAEQVREQDRANVAAFVESQPGFTGPTQQAPGTTLSPDILADANQRIARTLAESRTIGPQPGAERGDFNLATTSRVGPGGEITSTLRQPRSAGLSGLGSFGGESASQYLQRIAQQDQQQAAAVRERRREAQEGIERIGLRNAITQGTPQERRAARQQLEALDQRAGLRISEAGATERQALQLQGDVLRAETAGAAGLQAALARAAGQQQAAETAGRFDLQQAETTALGRVAAAQEGTRTGANLLATQRARQLAIQEELLRQAQAAGDVSGTFAAAGLSRPPTQGYTDPLTGAPLSNEQIRLLQQQALSRLSPQQ